jgi:hypothetical protein
MFRGRNEKFYPIAFPSQTSPSIQLSLSLIAAHLSFLGYNYLRFPALGNK